MCARECARTQSMLHVTVPDGVQVYLARWKATPVAVKVLDGHESDAWTTLGSPILENSQFRN
jgi:hypothetical protein